MRYWGAPLTHPTFLSMLIFLLHALAVSLYFSLCSETPNHLLLNIRLIFKITAFLTSTLNTCVSFLQLPQHMITAKIYRLIVLEAEVWSQDVRKATLCLEALWKDASLLFPLSQAVDILWLLCFVAISLQSLTLSSHCHSLPARVSNLPLLFSYKDTCPEFRAYLDNPWWSEIL